MFHLQTLELVHWDYCQRVSLPLDASIITIAGPNGSGKTTLLDGMRTLRQDAVEKMLAGLTSLDEVRSVADL